MEHPPSPARWRQIEPLLDAALDLPPEQRSAFLDAACPADAELRAEVERLLLACTESEGFLREPAQELAAPILANLAADPDPPAPAAPGSRVGPYRVLEEAGRGGMAVVYRAERDDGQFRKRVALKLVGAGTIPQDELLRRFREERQILAELEHPGIARLLDGGVTDEGLPWFALEYVEGTPIDRFCDEHRLNVGQRLALFGAVCDAVQHAHRQRIVHRDLKPGNILVAEPDAEDTEPGRVKLLDFGIAKLLAEEVGTTAGERTRPGLRLLTPEYASPEQLRGEAVTPAADVYALGVLLYRLLCGRHPYRLTGRTVEGIEQRVLDTQPEPASAAVSRAPEAGVEERGELDSEAVAAARSTSPEQLSRQLRGDLDAIVLKALGKEAEQRYGSAGELGAEVRRHLRGARVEARRGPRRRGVGAFLRRRRGVAAVAAAAMMVAAFPGYLVRSQPPGPALDPQRVVVAPFENRTGRSSLDPVGSMAADWIIHGLSHTGLVDVVPVTAALSAADFVIRSPGGADTVERIRLLARETAAGIVVSGAYYQQGDSLYLRATVTDASAGRVLHALEPIATHVTLPLEGIEQLRQRLMGALAAHLNPRMREHAARTGLAPPSFDAYRAHAEGLELFVARDWRAALTRFTEAAGHDSSFMAPLLYSGLTFTYLSDLAAVDSILVLARPRLHLVHEGERLGFDFLEARVRGDLAAAHRAHLRSPELAPGGLAHWGLANSALWVNRPRETIRVSRELDPERGELRGWFFYWRDLAYAHHRLGEHREELRVARRARELFPDERSAVLLEVRALAALRRHRELNRLLAEPLHADRNPVGLLRAAGQELLAHGASAAGETRLREALDLHRSQRSDDPRFRFFLADSHRLVGELEEAERLLRELAAEQPEVLTMNVQGTLGGLAARRGDADEAARASTWLAELDRPYLRGGNTYFRARIASLLGEREEALWLLQQSHREGLIDFWLVIHTEPDFASLRDYPPFQEFIRPKG